MAVEHPVIPLAEVVACVDRWKPRLGLVTWRIDVVRGDVNDETARMEIAVSAQYERAVIHVAEWYSDGQPPTGSIYGRSWNDPQQSVTQTVIHELLHCATRDMKQVAQFVIDGQLQRDVDIVYCRAYDRAEEAAIDRLAVALTAAWGPGA